MAEVGSLEELEVSFVTVLVKESRTSCGARLWFYESTCISVIWDFWAGTEILVVNAYLSSEILLGNANDYALIQLSLHKR